MNEHDLKEKLLELRKLGDEEAAIVFCTAPSRASQVLCQRYLGWLYAKREDFEQASTWYLKAALQGNVDAAQSAFACTQKLDSLGRRTRAIELCAKAPLSDFTQSQRFLVRAFHEQGNMDETLKWALRVAEGGAAEDLLYVGRQYLARKDFELARSYLERSSDAGCGRASQLVGEIFRFGLGVHVNLKTAASYYAKAAKHGYILSKMRLAYLRRLHGGTATKLMFFLRAFSLMAEFYLLKFMNAEDERLADVAKQFRQ